MPWVDIGVCAVVLIFAIVGCFRGFLKTLLGLFSTIVTIVIAVLLSKLFNGWFESWFGLNSALSGALHPSIEGECSDGVISGVLLIFAQIVMKGYDITDSSVVSSPDFIDAFSNSLGTILGTAITVVILFILLRILVFILSIIIEKITSINLVGKIDKGLGLLLGIIKGALVVFLIFGVVYLLSPIIPGLSDLVTNVTASNPITAEVYSWSCKLMDEVIIPWFNR